MHFLLREGEDLVAADSLERGWEVLVRDRQKLEPSADREREQHRGNRPAHREHDTVDDVMRAVAVEDGREGSTPPGEARDARRINCESRLLSVSLLFF